MTRLLLRNRALLKHSLQKTLVLVIAASVTVACMPQNSRPQSADATNRLSQGGSPAWLTNTPEMPGMAYGVGSIEVYGNKTEALKRAGELARVDLVSHLNIKKKSDFSSDITERSGTNRESEVQKVIRNHVRSQVPPVELDEAQIVKTHIDGKYAYALAELDRSKAAARLRRDLLEVDDQLQQIAAKQPQGNRLQQLQPLLPALTLFAKRDRIAERLALVSMDRRKPRLDSDLVALQDRINTLIDRLQVTISLQDSGAQEIGGGIIEALTDQGLRVADSGADLVFEVNAALTGKEQRGSFYVFADSRVTIRDGGGRALSSFSKQAKGVSGLEDVARQKAARNVAKMLGQELAVALVDKIN